MDKMSFKVSGKSKSAHKDKADQPEVTPTDNPTARLGGEPIRTPAQLTGVDGTASAQVARDCNNRSAQHTGDGGE